MLLPFFGLRTVAKDRTGPPRARRIRARREVGIGVREHPRRAD